MSMDIELFKVILREDGNIGLQFSDQIKASISVPEIEKLLKEDVQEHLTPIITKVIEAAF